jgi:hypothetical protein
MSHPMEDSMATMLDYIQKYLSSTLRAPNGRQGPKTLELLYEMGQKSISHC